jgi:outer membrane protein OmpA-like peptidoglycan-associated protein
MAVPKPEDVDTRERSAARKTPGGVWIIVGMAVLFVLGALSVSAFVIWKAFAEKKSSSLESSKPAEESVVSETEVSVSGTPALDPVAVHATSDTVSNPRAQDEVRYEVLKRIDLMKGLSDRDKDRLYAQVEKARGFVKIATIAFTQGKSMAGAAQTEELIKRLQTPELRGVLDDPTVVLVVLGYADVQGDEEKNRAISRARAESVIKELRDKTTISNIMHPVAMGGQSFFDATNAERNRLVEVWVAQP